MTKIGIIGDYDASFEPHRIQDEITGGEYCLPPDLDELHPASKGNYTLKATGRVVTAPHYTTQWTRTAPPPK